MKNKVIALVIEAALLFIGFIVAFICSSIGYPINYIILIVYFGVLIFAALLTLSLISYDRMRDIRSSDLHKGNLPIYTDRTTLLGHDIKDEERKKKDD